jgi:hypothetical protein
VWISLSRVPTPTHSQTLAPTWHSVNFQFPIQAQAFPRARQHTQPKAEKALSLANNASAPKSALLLRFFQSSFSLPRQEMEIHPPPHRLRRVNKFLIISSRVCVLLFTVFVERVSVFFCQRWRACDVNHAELSGTCEIYRRGKEVG